MVCISSKTHQNLKSVDDNAHNNHIELAYNAPRKVIFDTRLQSFMKEDHLKMIYKNYNFNNEPAKQ